MKGMPSIARELQTAPSDGHVLQALALPSGIRLVVHPLQPRKPFARILDRAQLLIPIVSDALFRLLRCDSDFLESQTVLGCWCRNGTLKYVTADASRSLGTRFEEMADADKDRRSRMAISTVHAPPKKGGAGGAFTWGSATDTSIDFDASKVQQPVKVITGGPVAQPTVAATPFTANIASAQQFPALGTRTVTAPMASSAWAARPPVVAAAGATPQPVTAGVPQPVTMAPTTMAPTTMAPTTVVQPMRPVVQPAAAISATTRTVASTMTQQTVQAPYPVSATSYPAPMPTYAAPVAAPRVIKEVAEKDRRSRMAYSTYHQAPKKGGAGGAYTWGSAGDVKDFDPTAPVHWKHFQRSAVPILG
eukprot:symbB.v1.2.001222.t1/scaffold66.1/size357995/25